MNVFDNLIAKNLSSNFNDWHDGISVYADIDKASQALYEAARRSPTMYVGLSYGALVKLLANFCDAWTAKYSFTAESEESLAGYIYRTFRLLSAMDSASPERNLATSYPVREDIVKFLDDFITSGS